VAQALVGSDLSGWWPTPGHDNCYRMSPAVLVLVSFALLIGVYILLVIYNNKKEKERTQALQQAAGRLALSFTPATEMTVIPGLDGFPLFGEGHGKKIRNFMYGEAQGVKTAVFDYVYTTGNGKSSQTYYQTVVYLEPANLSLPAFSLRPENFMHKMLSALGYQDIDFGQRPGFSSQYILRGPDELAIRQAFNDRALAWFESYPNTSVDAAGNQFFVFRAGYRCGPSEIEGHVGLGLQIMNLLRPY